MAFVNDVPRIFHRIDDATPDETARAVNELSALVCSHRLNWDLALSGAMPPAIRARLLRVLAMTSSTHQGEVWAALDRATDIVRRAGLSWIAILPTGDRLDIDAPETDPPPPRAASPDSVTPLSTAAKPHGVWDGLIYSWRHDPGVAFPFIAPFILLFGAVEAVLSAPGVISAAYQRSIVAQHLREWRKHDDGIGADML